MNNDYKQKLQEKEFEALKGKQRVVLKWATGVGKSKMTIDLVNYAVDNIPHAAGRPATVLFVVAEKAHIDNWRKEFYKWKLNSMKMRATIICYASLHKVKDKAFDAIIFDEAHHMFTEKRLAIIETLRAPYIYLLSATLPSKNLHLVESIFGAFTASSVTLKEAINNDILPDPRVYVVEMELDNTVANQKIETKKSANAPTVSWAERMKYVINNKPCIIECTERQKYAFYTERMEYWKKRYEFSHNPYHQNMWVNTGSVRKRFMGELKTDTIKQLLRLFPRRKRYVCFCSSVAQAEELNNSNTISSKRSSILNQRIIDAFNSKKLHNIFAVGMITEGMNLNDIQAAIIVQLDGKERLFIQKFGRSLRAEDPVSFIFYYKNTQDEIYLNNALENIDAKYIRRINLTQLNNIKL